MRIILFLLLTFNLAGQSAWFPTNFQVLQSDSNIDVYHLDIDVVIDPCWIRLDLDGAELYRYDLTDIDVWEIGQSVERNPVYILTFGFTVIMVNVIERWFYLKTPSEQFQLYYEIPKKFTIKI